MSEHDLGSELKGSNASSQGTESQTAAQTEQSGGASLAPKTSPVASLPEGWEQRINPKGTIYFVDHNTKTTHWHLPDDEDAESLPEGWEVRFNKDGKRYYINHNTKSTSWTKPGPGVQHSLPEGWEVRKTKDGRVFYVNHTLKTTQWDPPEIKPSSEPSSTSQDTTDAAPISRPITLDSKLAVPASVKVVAPIYARRLMDRTIRLLKVEAGSGDDTLCCSLFEVAPGSNPSFEAISYHWGDASDKINVICNGNSIGITRNLHQLLWQMRQEHKLGSFWADAICINQSDDVEKTSQVQMMKDIYASATNVLVWLGPEQATDRVAIHLIKRIYNTLGSPKLPIMTGGRHEKLPDLGLPAIYDGAWLPLRNIFQRTWFTRIWVLQEFIVARSCEFRCGPLTLPSDQMQALVLNMMQFEQLQLLPIIHKFDFSPFPWLYRHNYNDSAPEARGGRMSHFQLMTMTAKYDATDPRDKIFALVGLSRDGEQDIIDYSKNHEDVLMDVALRKFRQASGPAQLNGIMPMWAMAKPDRLYELPSWVYDYQSLPKFEPFSMGFAQCLFKGEPEVPPNLRIEARFLYTGVMVFDRIGTVLQGQPWKRFVSPADAPMAKDGLVMIGVEPTHSYIVAMIEWITACQTLARSLGSYPKDAPGSVLSKQEKEEYGPGPRTASQVLWRALVCDKDKGDGFRLHKQYGASYSAWVAWHRLAASCAVDPQYVEGTIQERMHIHPTEFKLPTRYGPLYTTHPMPLPDVEVHENKFKFSISHLMQEMTLDARLKRVNLKTGAADEPLGARLARLNNLMTPFDSLYGQFCHGRKFFSTQAGYMGWVPEYAHEGDELCVFDGSMMPFVIRPVASENANRYKLVGSAYVHGLMYGGARANGRGNDKTITLV